MREGKTRTGFEYKYDETLLDDMRFLDLLSELMDDETPELKILASSTKLINMMLGKDGKKALYDHIAALNDGRVPTAVAMAEIGDILNGSNDIKN